MAMTNAEKQAGFRQRREARFTELEAENERLRNQGGDGEIAELRRKMAQDRQTLDWALEAIKLLKAQNKRMARGESIDPEPQPAKAAPALPPNIDLSQTNDPGMRALYEGAPPDVKAWLHSFGDMPRKDAKIAHQAFLCLTAVGVLSMGKTKAALAGEAKAAREKHAPEPASLTWGKNGVGDPAAIAPAGEFLIIADRPDKGRFATFFQPKPGPRGGRMNSQGIGNFPTLDEAKAACQEHARAVT